MFSRRTTRSSRWRRSTLFAAGAVAAAAMIGPASASAGWSTVDPSGGTTPNGHGSAPDETASNGDAAYGIGGYSMTETTSTIPNAPGSCDWTVRGRLIVRNPTVDGLADGDPLEGVMVQGVRPLLKRRGPRGWLQRVGRPTRPTRTATSPSPTTCASRAG